MNPRKNILGIMSILQQKEQIILEQVGAHTHTKKDKVALIVDGRAGLIYRKQMVFAHKYLPFRSFTLNYQNYQKQPLLSALCGCSPKRVIQKDNISSLL